MESQTLEARVDALEHIVNGENGVLARLDKLSGEVSELRHEMRNEFVAVRREMRDEFAAVRAEMHEEFAAVRGEMRDEFAAVRGEMRGELAALRGEMRDEFAGVVRREVAAGNEETRNYMRVLYEDAIARIAASRG